MSMLSSSQLASALFVATDTIVRELKRLAEFDLIEKVGVGKATRYIKKR